MNEKTGTATPPWKHARPTSRPCEQCHGTNNVFDVGDGDMCINCMKEHDKSIAKSNTYYGHCPKCGELLGFGHLPEKCGTAPTPESKCPTCGSLDKSKRGPRLIGGHTCFDLWHESKPTSEGARTLDETVNEIVHGIWCRYAEEEIPTKDFDADKAIVTKAIDTYAAPFRSQLAAAEKERDEFRDALQCRTTKSESEIQRLRERIDAVHGYLSRLFEQAAPQCKPSDDTLTLASQIDNLIAGLRERIAELEGSK